MQQRRGRGSCRYTVRRLWVRSSSRRTCCSMATSSEGPLSSLRGNVYRLRLRHRAGVRLQSCGATRKSNPALWTSGLTPAGMGRRWC